MHRAYLVPVRSPRGYVGVGVATGLLVTAGITIGAAVGLRVPGSAGLLACALAAFSPFAVVALLMSRAVPGFRVQAVTQLTGLATALVLVCARVILMADDGGLSTQLDLVGAFGLFTVGFLLAGTLIASLLWIGSRAVFGRPMPDDERLCAGCEYEYGSGAQTCPECGAGRTPRRYRARWSVATASALHRRWGVVAALCGLIACMDVGVQVVNATIPAVRFCLSVPGSVPIKPGSAVDALRLQGPVDAAAVVWVPERGGDGTRGLGIAARILHRRVQDMHVAVTTAPKNAAAWTGSVLVVARLDAAQSKHVLRHGLPPALVEAMFREADRRGWTPTAPTPTGPSMPVNTAPFFPAPE